MFHWPSVTQGLPWSALSRSRRFSSECLIKNSLCHFFAWTILKISSRTSTRFLQKSNKKSFHNLNCKGLSRITPVKHIVDKVFVFSLGDRQTIHARVSETALKWPTSMVKRVDIGLLKISATFEMPCQSAANIEEQSILMCHFTLMK